MQKNICALVVDDDSSMRNILSVILRSIGVSKILVASDGREALDLINGKGADTNLIICDLNMPGMDGLTFLEKIKPTKSDVPFIMLSGDSSTAMFYKAKSAGADYYFMKPIDPSDLTARLQSII